MAPLPVACCLPLLLGLPSGPGANRALSLESYSTIDGINAPIPKSHPDSDRSIVPQTNSSTRVTMEDIKPRTRQAWVTMLFGNSRNSTVLVEVQLQSLKDLAHRTKMAEYDHITMVTPEVFEVTRQKLRYSGSMAVEVEPIEMPADAMANVGETMKSVWKEVFTKLRIWNMTMYDQVTFIDADAFVGQSMQTAAQIFEACPAAFCAIQDSMLQTPRGNK
eukprot:3353413-Prymnesium_polylepis.1